jgi:hypothetical protein
MSVHVFPDNHSLLVGRLFLQLRAGVTTGRVRPGHVPGIINLAVASHCGIVQLMIDELTARLDTSQHVAPSSPP